MPRPSTFKPEYIDQVEKLSKLGATDIELADFFGVTERTLNNWKKSKKTFFDSMKRGKIQADAEVANKLFDRATGYEWDEQQPIKIKQVDYENGKRVREVERVEVFTVHKIVPPDTTASIFWLKNRRSSDWRDKQDFEHSGKNGDPIESNMNITYMPEPLSDDYFRRQANNNDQ